MAYNRTPQITLAGLGLTQNPPSSIVQPPGIVPVTLDANIATTTNLGIVQIGSGLSITVAGVLSTNGSSSSIMNVTLTGVNYTATATDLYIGATVSGITITLPPGILGRVYYVKNQSTGNITVQGTGQNIDGSASKTLNTSAAITMLFDGARWNLL